MPSRGWCGLDEVDEVDDDSGLYIRGMMADVYIAF